MKDQLVRAGMLSVRIPDMLSFLRVSSPVFPERCGHHVPCTGFPHFAPELLSYGLSTNTPGALEGELFCERLDHLQRLLSN